MFLLQSRAKIGRANLHIQEIERRIVALGQSDYAVVEAHREHGTDRLIHTLDESILDTLALVIGDAVHNLNCALDYTWLQTIERLAPANVSDRAKFPVHQKIEELCGVLKKGNMHITCPSLFNFMIDDIKPCENGNAAIWAIHSFANRDKHRLLIPVLAEVNIDGIEVKDEFGEVITGFAISAPQRPPYVVDLKPGLHFTREGELTASVVVEDGKSGCLMHIPQTLIHHCGAVASVVESFEGFLASHGC